MIRGSATAFRRRHKRILIVEGVTPVGEVLARQLMHHGYEVEMARSAREALLLAQAGRWDAVVLNIGLPEMNGVELYTRLNRDCGRECLPVIFVSGYAGQYLLQALRKVSLIPPRMKPFSVSLFLNTLEQCLQNGELSAST